MSRLDFEVMGTRGSDSEEKLKEQFLKEEILDENEVPIEEKKNLKRFVSIVKKIIILNKTRKVVEISKQEEIRIDMADDFKMTLPIFDGKDYSTWKKRITVLLKMKKCEEVIQRVRAENDNEATWNEKDLKAMNYIYGALSNRQMELVNDENTSYEIIKKLDRLYLRESTALQICVRNRLDRLRLRDYTEVSEIYNQFGKLIIALMHVVCYLCL